MRDHSEGGEKQVLTYECDDCGVTVEVEVMEVYFGNNEPYEFNICQGCFDKEYKEEDNGEI
jgi:hypothetical protein